MAKIIIIGATGFIGKNLLAKLVVDKSETKCLVRKKSELIGPLFDQVELIEGDITDKQSLKNLVELGDTVYYLAGAVGKHSPNEYYKINIAGLENVIEYCRGRVNKFVYFSSASAVGDSSGVIDETTDCQPRTDYGKTKLQAESILLNFYQKEKFPVVIIRPPIVYGPYDLNESRDLSMIKLIKYVRAKKFFLVGPGGGSRRSICFVGNLIQGAMVAAENKKTSGQIYFLADPAVYDLLDLAKIIAKEENILFQEKHHSNFFVQFLALASETSAQIRGIFPQFNRRVASAMTRDLFCSIKKAQDDFNYEPAFSTEQAIKITMAWYRVNNIIKSKK